MIREEERLRLILEIIERIERRLKNVPRSAMFADDRDELDLTAYCLGSIGEVANKLSPELKGRHPEVDWRGMYHLRNIVAHEYDFIDPALVWSVAGGALEQMKALCQSELEKLPTPGSPDASP